MVLIMCLNFCGCKNVGYFLWLDQAYAQNWINKEDLKNIAFNYNIKHFNGDVDYGDDFLPIGLPLDTLSDKVKNEVKEAFCNEYEITKDKYDEVTIFSEYYGFFSNCYIVDLTTTCLIGGDPLYYEEYDIDGVKFYNYHFIGVYKKIN